MAPFIDHSIKRGNYRLYAREYGGSDPPIVLMHGFPDNLHLYDRLVAFLSPPRRVIVFDFLGWGLSDKPSGYAYSAANQEADLDAVINQLELANAVLVAHDASGPPAIDWARHHLNGWRPLYCSIPTTVRCRRSDHRKRSSFSRHLSSGMWPGLCRGCSII